MLWVYGHVLFFEYGYRLQTSESDVYKRQILMSKFDPRNKRLLSFLLSSFQLVKSMLLRMRRVSISIFAHVWSEIETSL